MVQTCLSRHYVTGFLRVAIMPFTFGGAETMGAPHYSVPGLPRAQRAPGTQKASVHGVGAGGGGFLSRRPSSQADGLLAGSQTRG